MQHVKRKRVEEVLKYGRDLTNQGGWLTTLHCWWVDMSLYVMTVPSMQMFGWSQPEKHLMRGEHWTEQRPSRSWRAVCSAGSS